ncbi:MAG: PLP-dependent aminotransferase family protein, partial [Flavobacteriales bacterium]|nr:PLP-dependent aminotransferase family protein [Flavobacteriales bacterium]
MLPYGDLIQIDRNLETPIYLQITRAIIQIIEGNQVPLSTRLPSSRSLSKSLGVHRNTILKSFEELELQGWITTIKAKGTYINNSLPRKQLYHNQANSDPQEFDCPKSTLDVFFPEKPDEGIFIDDGLPDHDMIEFVEFSRALNKTLRNNQKLKSLQRNRDPLGSVKLRRALTKYLFKTRGISSKEDEILITNGSQMGIYLCGKLLLRGNQPYLVGSSNYPVADATFSSISPNVYHIPVDENGWDTSHLQQMIPKNNIKMMYLTPHHHYPTTVTLSIKRRLELIREAKQH